MYEPIKRGADVAVFPSLSAFAPSTTRIMAIGSETPHAIGAVLPLGEERDDIILTHFN